MYAPNDFIRGGGTSDGQTVRAQKEKGRGKGRMGRKGGGQCSGRGGRMNEWISAWPNGKTRIGIAKDTCANKTIKRSRDSKGLYPRVQKKYSLASR